MKYRIETTKKEVAEVDIDFPFYRRHDVSGDDYSCVIYTRIEFVRSGLVGLIVKQHSITYSASHGRRGEAFELEIEITGLSGSEMDYALGRGEYACTREEFESMLEKAAAFLTVVRG